MSEQKWAVLRAEPGHDWLVAHPGDVRHYDGRLDCWEVHSRHDTWTEAMQEADRMARTTTVTLPRVRGKAVIPSSAPTHLTIHRSGNGVHICVGDSLEGTNVREDELEPVARVLLAHARRRA